MPLEQTRTRLNASAILAGPNTFATVLIVLMIDFYGTEFMKWSPETIRMESEEDFGFSWPQVNFDRLMAGVAIVASDYFYQSLPDFIELCNILSGAAATPGVFDPADPSECAWGITEALLLSPPDSDEPFNEEIRAYIGKVCEMEGIINLPDILRIGIVSSNMKIKVSNNFSDDPEIYSAIWKNESDKTEDINDLVKSRLALLIEQLASLPLTNGNTDKIAKRMLKNLDAHPRGGSAL